MVVDEKWTKLSILSTYSLLGIFAFNGEQPKVTRNLLHHNRVTFREITKKHDPEQYLFAWCLRFLKYICHCVPPFSSVCCWFIYIWWNSLNLFFSSLSLCAKQLNIKHGWYNCCRQWYLFFQPPTHVSEVHVCVSLYVFSHSNLCKPVQ